VYLVYDFHVVFVRHVTCAALGGEIRHNDETLDLLKDYLIQLRRHGNLQSAVMQVPAADGLTTAYLLQGTAPSLRLFIRYELNTHTRHFNEHFSGNLGYLVAPLILILQPFLSLSSHPHWTGLNFSYP